MELDKPKNYDFENIKIPLQFKLSLLWIAVTLLYLYGDYFELYVPETAEDLVSGKNLLNSPMKLFIAASLLAIPALMVILSSMLKPKISRILNIIFGLVFTAIMLLIAITNIEPWRSFYVLYALIESVITSLIVWYAFKWPKKQSLN